MKDKIEQKIQDIVDYIIHKPVEEVTLDDYTILTNELTAIRAAESKTDNSKRMAELLAMVTSSSGSA